MQQKPLAVQRREYISNSGPTIFGINRLDKVVSPEGERFIFLGARDGEAVVEREDKTKGTPFLTVDSSDFTKWRKVS